MSKSYSALTFRNCTFAPNGLECFQEKVAIISNSINQCISVMEMEYLR